MKEWMIYVMAFILVIGLTTISTIDTKSHSSSDDSFFTHGYRVQHIYDSEESLEGDGDGKIRIGGVEI